MLRMKQIRQEKCTGRRQATAPERHDKEKRTYTYLRESKVSQLINPIMFNSIQLY